MVGAATATAAVVGAGSSAYSAYKGSKGGGGQTATGTNAPWEVQQPYLAAGFQNASNLYNANNAGIGGQGIVASPDAVTVDYLARTYNRAHDGSPVVDSAKNSVNDILNGGYNNPSTGYFTNQANNLSYADNPASSYFQGAQGGQYLNSNPVNNFLSGTASGAYLNSNPYVDATYDKAARAINRNYSEGVAPGVASSFEKAGRYGSGLYRNAQDQAQENYGQALGDLATGIYGQNYAQERQNQIGAANSIGNAYAGERNLQQGAAGNLGSIYQQQGARQDQAAQTLSNNYNTSQQQILQAASLAPGLANQDYVDLNNMRQVGQTQDAYQQSLLDAPYTALQRYQQAISGNYGGVSTQTTPNQGGGFGSALGSLGQMAGAYFGGGSGSGGSGGMLAGNFNALGGNSTFGRGGGTTLETMPWLSGGY